MKRNFNISVKRSKDYQSVEVSLGFEGDFTEEDFLHQCNTTTMVAKERVAAELALLGKQQIKLDL